MSLDDIRSGTLAAERQSFSVASRQACAWLPAGATEPRQVFRELFAVGREDHDARCDTQFLDENRNRLDLFGARGHRSRPLAHDALERSLATVLDLGLDR